MGRIINEIKDLGYFVRSFAEDRETFERTLGAITGISINVAAAGALLAFAGNNYDSNGAYQTGINIIKVGVVGAISSFAGGLTSQAVHYLKNRNRRQQ